MAAGGDRQADQSFEFGVRQAVDRVDQPQALRRAFERGQVGVDALDAADAGQRVGAAARPSCSRPAWSAGPSSPRSAWRRWPGPSRRRRRGSRPLAGVQLARSPVAETWKAPSTQMSRWPPRIIAKLSAWWKIGAARQQRHRLLAGVDEVVVLRRRRPAPGPCRGCRSRCAGRPRRPAGRWLATSVGMPMPRLTYGAVGDVLRHARRRAGSLVRRCT